jgi:hypothetical protein
MDEDALKEELRPVKKQLVGVSYSTSVNATQFGYRKN